MRTLNILLLVCCTVASVFAQQQTGAEQSNANSPQVRVNYLNVCSPSDSDRKELDAVLSRIPAYPKFAPDLEVDRGRSTAPGAPSSDWVRIRREFTSEAPFTNAQYTFSVNDDGKKMAETLVFRSREMKAGLPLEVSLQDTVSSGTPAALLASDTPAERIRMERFGGASVVLARCPSADQSAYEPLFRRASEILAGYRDALRVRQTVPGDLARVAAAANGAGSAPRKKAQRRSGKSTGTKKP